MEQKKAKVIRRRKGFDTPAPSKKGPSKESWEKLKETALQKGWIKNPDR